MNVVTSSRFGLYFHAADTVSGGNGGADAGCCVYQRQRGAES